MSVKHFYINTELNDYSAYKEAMRFACELATTDPKVKNIILLAASKNHVSWLEKAFDTSTVKKLFKGLIFDGCRPLYKIETVKTYNKSFNPQDIIITMAIDDEYILPLVDLYSTIAIIAIPWQIDGIQTYLETFSPTDIRSGNEYVPTLAELSCIVKTALTELSQSINHSTGITNPNDNRRSKTTVLALHKYESHLDAEAIKAYLIRDLNWNTEHAEDIAVLIRTLNEGRSFQGGTRTGLQNYYKAWKTKCK